jgi:hypothetical protein
MISEWVCGSFASQPVRKRKTDHNPLPPAPPGTHEGPASRARPSLLPPAPAGRIGPQACWAHSSCSSRESPGPRLRSPATSGETEGEEIVPELRLLPSNPDDRINYEREPTLVRANTYYGQRGGRRHPSHPNYN